MGAATNRVIYTVDSSDQLHIGGSYTGIVFDDPVASITFSGDVTTAATGAFIWSTRSKMTSPADGQILVTNNAGSDFARLLFGGTSNSFPSLKRSSAALEFKLADDSGYTDAQADDVRAEASSAFHWNGRARLESPADLVVGPRNAADSADGWFVDVGRDRRSSTQTVTDSTALVADNQLSVAVIAGRKYGFRLVYYMEGVDVTSGAKMDMGGGSATFTDFLADARVTNLSTYAIAAGGQLATSTTAIGFTALGALDMFEIQGAFTVNAGGSFGPRLAQNAETGASEDVTASINSHLTVWDIL